LLTSLALTLFVGDKTAKLQRSAFCRYQTALTDLVSLCISLNIHHVYKFFTWSGCLEIDKILFDFHIKFNR